MSVSSSENSWKLIRVDVSFANQLSAIIIFRFCCTRIGVTIQVIDYCVARATLWFCRVFFFFFFVPSTPISAYS